MTTPARSRDQKSAPIDDLSPTLTLPEDYEHADEHTRSPARPRGLLLPLGGTQFSWLLADPHDPGCGGRAVTTDFGRIALTLDAGGEALGCAPVCEGGGPKPGSVLRDGRLGSFGFGGLGGHVRLRLRIPQPRSSDCRSGR